MTSPFPSRPDRQGIGRNRQPGQQSTSTAAPTMWAGHFAPPSTGGDGGITIGTAAMHADMVKIGAFGNDGSLTIGGGTISGDTLLKLYAPGSNGTIDFVSNVTLNSDSSVIIAGRTVTILDDVVVTITGNNDVRCFRFTRNVPNYTGSGGNGSTTGIFAGNGANHPANRRCAAVRRSRAAPEAPHKGSTSFGRNHCVTPNADPGLPVNRGPGADATLPRPRPRVATIRVADSNELLDLADKVTSGSIEAGHRRIENAGRQDVPRSRKRFVRGKRHLRLRLQMLRLQN